MNLKVREFQQAIINFANQSDLPIEVKRLCVADVLKQLEEQANEALRKEVLQRNVAEKERNLTKKNEREVK